MTPPRISTLVTLLLASTLVVMAGAVLVPILEVMRDDLGITGTAAGLVITVHAMAIALASPFIGWLIDRRGVRAPLPAGLGLYGPLPAARHCSARPIPPCLSRPSFSGSAPQRSSTAPRSPC